MKNLAHGESSSVDQESQKDTEATWNHYLQISPNTSHYMEAVFSIVRKIHGGEDNDVNDESDRGYDSNRGDEGELSDVCSQIVLKCSYLARIGRPDILWSVNKHARSNTKWTKACDKVLERLISYIHHTSKYWQYCYVGNTAQQCRRGLFQDSDFVGDLEDSKSTSGGILCIFGSQTFVPISWMCKKQTSVSHSSTEAEVISLDTGLRMDCISRSRSLGFGD